MFGNARRGVSYLREDVTVINTRSPLFFGHLGMKVATFIQAVIRLSSKLFASHTVTL